MDAKMRRKLLYDCPKHGLVDQIAEIESKLAEARELLSADQRDRLTGSWEARRDALLGEESE